MPHRDIQDSAAFLPDLLAQRLCLQDALATHNPAAMLHALQAVARARGAGRLAREVGLEPAELAGVLDDANGQMPERITALARLLLDRIVAAEAAPPSAKMAKTGHASSKTAPSGQS